MSNYSPEERYSRLPYPIHKVKATSAPDLFEIMPGLRRYFKEGEPMDRDQYPIDQFTGNPIRVGPDELQPMKARYRGEHKEDVVRIIKYIMFVYDPDSDLVTEYGNDTRLLKDAAAKDAGFRRSKEREGEWPKYVQDIIDFKEPDVVRWIIQYLKVRQNPIWQEIKFLEEEIELLYKKRAKAMLEGEVKADSMSMINARLEQKDLLYKKFYANHSDLRRVTEKELFPITPENVFKEMNIPDEVWKVRQVKDVPKDQGFYGVHNRSDVQSIPAPDTEEGADFVQRSEEI